MKSSPLACCLSLLLLGVAPLAQAQDEDASTSPFSGTFAVTSDYLFRGISQTNEEPAFQAGLTYKTPFGLYLGTWSSNVDFGAGDPDWEVDGFVGYNTDLGTHWNFDVMINRYQYLGAGASNYAELITKTTFLKTYSVTVAYTDDLYGSKTDGYYYAFDANWTLPYDFTLGAHAGHSVYTSSLSQVDHDYNDFGVNVGKTFGPLGLSVGYYDTSKAAEFGFGRQNSQNHLVATATVTWP
ncbi:hypothetical protein IPT12_03810 [Xanthomonas perforans]|uniref:Porin n=9 Tax=Xanthomonas TaxID=338 RepID=A0A0G8VZ10_XANPE|nr:MULTISPECIES: TorF family putative porin [Xanthomonas]AOY68642.1 hypothetical protein BHE83_20215 [Xanthomonas euvesicatoria pv. vesicatoria str. 85-10]APO91572.1 hypothetical protein BJD11_17480 [Xanthomonas euvesicatoria]APO99656.1 hypothetical protein BJD13_11660 [Xanthomonas perforans]AQS76135.1 hypothetical protein XPE_07340 [Xanthomonas perforans 91-118]KHL63684.1 hypothetical protein XEU66b_01450 [Xanthomonas euvesicatoria]